MKAAISNYITAFSLIVAIVHSPEVVQAQETVSICRAVSEKEASLIKFESQNFRGQIAEVEGIFMQVAGGDPRPLVLLLPTYLGIEPPGCYFWVQTKLRDWGYDSLLIDHMGATTGDGKPVRERSLYDRLADIEGALLYLRSRREVADGIAAIGWSQGALSLFHVLDPDRAFNANPDFPIRAAIAFYPTCPVRTDDFPVPLLLLHGSADKVAPLDSCSRLAKSLGGSSNLALEIISGAGHQFDHPGHDNFDAFGADHAFRRVKEFLGLQLGSKK